MSIEPEKPPLLHEKPPASAAEGLLETAASVDANAETIAALAAKSEAEKDARYEERFTWLLLVAILFDAYVFTHMTNWAGALVIGLLQVIGIVILADRYKVNAVLPFIDKVTGFVRSHWGGDRGAPPTPPAS